MPELPSRELRNDTAGVLRRVEAGEVLTITVKGKPVAQLAALAPSRRRWLSRVELSQRLPRAQANPGLCSDPAGLVGDITEGIGPLQ
jgi:prevent-host-death family protein